MATLLSLLPFFLVLVFILLYGLFTLLKVALSRASQGMLERSIEEGTWGARQALRLLEDADDHILAGHIGRFLCAFFAGSASCFVWRELFTLASSFGFAGIGIPDRLLHILILGVSLFLLCCFAAVVVQLSKTIAARSPEQMLFGFGWFCSFFTRLVSPITELVQLAVSLFERLGSFESLPPERDITFSAEDLEAVIEQSNQAGTLDSSESELLQGALRLSELKVREIMTPRADIVSVGLECTVEQLRDVVCDAGFSRVLVTGEGLDDVRGMVLSKDLIPLIGKSATQSVITDLIREVPFVDGELSGDDVMRRLRLAQAHLAVVTDEHGGVDGIVTLEDLMEEIVGDIFDETDDFESEQDVTVMKSGDLLVDGGTPLADLADEFGIELPEGEYDTVAGFIIHRLGRIPEVGEEVKSSQSQIVVEQVEENRVTKLRIRKARKSSAVTV
ncbi:hemolysin family protein [bacterium]|nr:hemolysin family protein [bacterium]